MFTRRQRIVLASSLVVASTMLVLVAAYAQTQSTKTGNLPTATKATFDAKGVGSCPAGYVLDYTYPAASACRLQVQRSGNGACPTGYVRQGDGNCALDSVKPDSKGECPATSVLDKSSNRCKVCYQPAKDPDPSGPHEPKKCG